MATIPVGTIRPYRRVRTQHFAEGASQSFVAGDILTWSSTADTGNRVIKAGADPTTIVGVAAESASGTAATKIAVYVADEIGEFVGSVSTAVAAAAVLDADDVGDDFGLVADTTNACWRIDLSETTTAFCQIVELLDAAGDTNGRVVFHFLKSNATPGGRQPF